VDGPECPLMTQSGHRVVEWRLSSAKLPHESPHQV
jgi:hypothetical protein